MSEIDEEHKSVLSLNPKKLRKFSIENNSKLLPNKLPLHRTLPWKLDLEKDSQLHKKDN